MREEREERGGFGRKRAGGGGGAGRHKQGRGEAGGEREGGVLGLRDDISVDSRTQAPELATRPVAVWSGALWVSSPLR